VADCTNQFCQLEEAAPEATPAETEAPQMTVDEALQMVNDFQREDTQPEAPKKQPDYFWIFILQIGCLAIVGSGIYVSWMYLNKKGWFAEYSGKGLYEYLSAYKSI
jgi:hypothetical protein